MPSPKPDLKMPEVPGEKHQAQLSRLQKMQLCPALTPRGVAPCRVTTAQEAEKPDPRQPSPSLKCSNFSYWIQTSVPGNIHLLRDYRSDLSPAVLSSRGTPLFPCGWLTSSCLVSP